MSVRLGNMTEATRKFEAARRWWNRNKHQFDHSPPCTLIINGGGVVAESDAPGYHADFYSIAQTGDLLVMVG